MIVPKRVQQKKSHIKRTVFFTTLSVVLSVLIGIAVVYLGLINNLSAKNLVSPLSGNTFGKGVFGVFSKSPSEEIKHALNKANIPFEQVYSASNSAYIIKQKEGQEIILTSGKDIALQVATLQLILSRITIEGKSLSRIDLRFDKPIVVFR